MAAPTSDALAPAACENCGTALDAAFCPACGQSRINPIRHAGHALEEVFESFWHLDGRVFRTLRDLLAPGRVARDYIAGHRMRYVAPLRLFFVLSVLTFFVARSVVHLSPGAVQVDPTASATTPARADPSFEAARTVEEVIALRDARIAELRDARKAVAAMPLATAPLDKAIDMVEQGAQARIRALTGGSLPPPVPTIVAVDDDDALFDKDAKSTDNPVGLTVRGKPWHIEHNPVVVEGWPRVTRWLNARVAVAVRNAPRIQSDPDLLKTAILKSIPAALLMLVPVFALLLKLAYIRRDRLYLEHLTVALYSHAFLCVGLLGISMLTWLQDATTLGAIDTLLGWLKTLLWTWLPIYLLLTQKRVYAQEWGRTVLKFVVLGTVYALLLTFAVVPLFFVAFLRV